MSDLHPFQSARSKQAQDPFAPRSNFPMSSTVSQDASKLHPFFRKSNEFAFNRRGFGPRSMAMEPLRDPFSVPLTSAHVFPESKKSKSERTHPRQSFDKFRSKSTREASLWKMDVENDVEMMETNDTQPSKKPEPGKIICNYFNTPSGCSRGDSCQFLHIKKEGLSDSIPSKNALPAKKHNQTCRYWVLGTCNRGDLCEFLHGHDSVQASKGFYKEASSMETEEMQNKKLHVETSEADEHTVEAPTKIRVQSDSDLTEFVNPKFSNRVVVSKKVAKNIDKEALKSAIWKILSPEKVFLNRNQLFILLRSPKKARNLIRNGFTFGKIRISFSKIPKRLLKAEDIVQVSYDHLKSDQEGSGKDEEEVYFQEDIDTIGNEEDLASDSSAEFSEVLSSQEVPIRKTGPFVPAKIIDEFPVDRSQLTRSDGKLIGRLQNMCSASEIQERIESNEIHRLECYVGTNEPDLSRCVKKYRRSDAGKANANPDEVRPPHVLLKTLDYLFSEILDEQMGSLISIYSFLRDRTRAIRNDLSIQGDHGDEAVQIVERICRFHLMCHHELCEEDKELFDRQQNYQQISNCLLTLNHFYADRAAENVESSNESEFLSYQLLIFVSDTVQGLQAAKRISLSDRFRNSPYVEFANAVFDAYHEKNYSKFFLLAKSGTYIQKCALSLCFPNFRLQILQKLSCAYEFLSVAKFCEALGLDSDAATLSKVCKAYDLSLIGPDSTRIRLQHAKCSFETPFPVIFSREIVGQPSPSRVKVTNPPENFSFHIPSMHHETPCTTPSEKESEFAPSNVISLEQSQIYCQPTFPVTRDTLDSSPTSSSLSMSSNEAVKEQPNFSNQIMSSTSGNSLMNTMSGGISSSSFNPIQSPDLSKLLFPIAENELVKSAQLSLPIFNQESESQFIDTKPLEKRSKKRKSTMDLSDSVHHTSSKLTANERSSMLDLSEVNQTELQKRQAINIVEQTQQRASKSVSRLKTSELLNEQKAQSFLSWELSTKPSSEHELFSKIYGDCKPAFLRQMHPVKYINFLDIVVSQLSFLAEVSAGIFCLPVITLDDANSDLFVWLRTHFSGSQEEPENPNLWIHSCVPIDESRAVQVTVQQFTPSDSIQDPVTGIQGLVYVCRDEVSSSMDVLSFDVHRLGLFIERLHPGSRIPVLILTRFSRSCKLSNWPSKEIYFGFDSILTSQRVSFLKVFPLNHYNDSLRYDVQGLANNLRRLVIERQAPPCLRRVNPSEVFKLRLSRLSFDVSSFAGISRMIQDFNQCLVDTSSECFDSGLANLSWPPCLPLKYDDPNIIPSDPDWNSISRLAFFSSKFTDFQLPTFDFSTLKIDQNRFRITEKIDQYLIDCRFEEHSYSLLRSELNQIWHDVPISGVYCGAPGSATRFAYFFDLIFQQRLFEVKDACANLDFYVI